MNAQDVRDMTSDELREKEKQISEQLLSLRLYKVTGQLESPARIGQLRRDRARILTVLRERELAAEAQGGRGR